MPSFEQYGRLLGVKTDGAAHKRDSDIIMEATWNEDISAKVGWFYDQAHDNEFDVNTDLHPDNTYKYPIDVKHFEMEYNSLAKDEIAHHIMFRPNNTREVPYYEDAFGRLYKAQFPIGLYVDLQDEGGVYRRWLVVGEYRAYSNQFVSYLVLPCDHKLQWVYKNKKYESWGVLRSQSSYNSGIWTDFKVTSPENQKIIWLPMNSVTQTLFYDQRVIISEPRPEPLAWKVTKVEDMNVKGIDRITFAQDRFNEHSDFIETDEEGNVIGMWASYYDDGVEPVPADDPYVPEIHSKITYTGAAPQLKVGGSYKKFTVTFYNDEGEIPYQDGDWKFTIGDQDASDIVTTLSSEESDDVLENQIKVKFTGDDSYIGKELRIHNESETGVKSEIAVSVAGL